MWPSLVLIGGLDPGLRVGGSCRHKTTSKKGTLMGVSREGSATVKVHWDDGDSTVRLVDNGGRKFTLYCKLYLF